jgi:hypothetical protein
MPCGFAYRADFCRFLCASHRSWWEGSVAIAAFPPPPAAPAPRSNFSLNRPSLTAVGRFTHADLGGEVAQWRRRGGSVVAHLTANQ